MSEELYGQLESELRPFCAVAGLRFEVRPAQEVTCVLLGRFHCRRCNRAASHCLGARGGILSL